MFWHGIKLIYLLHIKGFDLLLEAANIREKEPALPAEPEPAPRTHHPAEPGPAPRPHHYAEPGPIPRPHHAAKPEPAPRPQHPAEPGPVKESRTVHCSRLKDLRPQLLNAKRRIRQLGT